MGLLGSSAQQVPTRFNQIRTNEAIYGTTIPVCFGQNRLSWKLLWYGDFKSAKAKEPGGSGLVKGGTQYVYSAAVLGLVCHGSATQLLGVWDSTGKYEIQSTTESYSITTGTPTYTVTNASLFTVDSGVSAAANYATPSNDYGGTGVVINTGSQNVNFTQVASAPGPGQYSVNASTGVYTFNAADAGTSVSISYIYYRYRIIEQQNGVVPNSAPYKIVVNNQPYFLADDGVTYFPSGIALTPVGGTPSTIGTYNPNGGNYLFAPGDADQGVTINYEYKDVNTDANAPNTLNLTFLNGAFGQSPWAYLTDSFPGQAIGYSECCCIASSGLYLGYSPLLPQYNFEVAALYQFGGGIVDACPSDCIEAVLTDPAFGVGFPEEYIQNEPAVQAIDSFNRTTFGSYWTTNEGTFVISSGKVEISAVGGDSRAVAFYNATTFPADQSVQMALGSVPGVGALGPAARIAATGETYYAFYQSTANWFLFKCIAGTVTVLKTGTRSPSVNDILTLSVDGEVLTAQINGVVVATTTDSSITSGQPGMAGDSTYTQSNSGATWSANALGIEGLQSTVRAYWAANNFFISPVMDSQTSAASTISDWLEAGQVYCFWSEGLLKFTPLGDTTAIGNGYTFTPPTNPVVSLDDDDFITEPGQDPIQIQRSPWQNRWNDVRIGWAVRTNSYNRDVLEASDAGSIQTYGLMREDPKTWEFLCTENAAQFAANLRLQRLVNVTTKFSFMIKENYWYLDPGDIVEVTDGIVGGPIGPLGFNQTPVRLLKLEYTDKGIKCEAENFPYSIATAVMYPKQGQLPSATLDVAQQDPGDTTPIIFEVPDRTAKFQGNILNIFASGENTNWGGCQVWLSFNGTDYSQYGTIETSARQGTLLAEPSNNTAVEYCGTGTDLGDNAQAWTNPTNIQGAPTGSYATNQITVPTNSGKFGNTLLASNFGLNIPSTATIVGITAAISGFQTINSGSFTDTTVGAALYFNGALLSVSADQELLALPSSTGTTTIGNSTDLWGASLTPAMLNAASFAVGFLPDPTTGVGTSGTITYSLDAVQITVYYTIPIALPAYAGTNPDTVDTLTVILSQASQLQSVTSADAAQGVSLCALISPAGTSPLTGDGPLTAGKGTSSGTGTAWTNPSNVTSPTSFASVALTANNSTVLSQQLGASLFNVNIPTTATVTGIEIEFDLNVSSAGGSDSAEVKAQLLVNGSGVGTVDTSANFFFNGVTSTIVLGGPSDMWGLSLTPADVNSNFGLSGFGYQLQIQFQNILGGPQTCTFEVRNCRVIVYYYVPGIELISYEDAVLVGVNTYALTTLYRGFYDTEPGEHQGGEQFVRLDPSIGLTYQYDSSYYGETIYFKFLSFNLYGNKLQALDAVMPYSFQLVGVGPGTIDLNTGGIQTGVGSVPTTFNGSFSYANTSTTLTWSWTAMTITRPNGQTTTVPNGSVVVSGLTPSTTYYFYPYYNDALDELQWVAGGVGTSTDGPIAQTAPSAAAAQEQSLANYVPLSGGAMTAATTASGSGGGGTGGGSGGCLRDCMKVRTHDGVKEIQEVAIGEEVWGPEGWTCVTRNRREPHTVFVRVETQNGEAIEVTSMHPLQAMTEEGVRVDVRAKELTLQHLLLTEHGVEVIVGIRAIVVEGGHKCIVTCEPSPLFYAGEVEPRLQTHNARPVGT